MLTGTLCDGTRMAWKKDVDKKNAYVQLAVSMDIDNCDLYPKTLPKDCARFLVDWGNIKNNDSTVITPLRIWRQTGSIDASFNMHKKATGIL